MLLKSNWHNSAVLAVHKLGSAVLLSVGTTVQEQRLQYGLLSRGSQYRDCGGASSPFFPFHAASSAFLLILRSKRASEMAQWIKPPTAKSDNLSSILAPFRSLRSGKNVPWGCNRMISNPYRQPNAYLCALWARHTFHNLKHMHNPSCIYTRWQMGCLLICLFI